MGVTAGKVAVIPGGATAAVCQALPNTCLLQPWMARSGCRGEAGCFHRTLVRLYYVPLLVLHRAQVAGILEWSHDARAFGKWPTVIMPWYFVLGLLCLSGGYALNCTADADKTIVPRAGAAHCCRVCRGIASYAEAHVIQISVEARSGHNILAGMNLAQHNHTSDAIPVRVWPINYGAPRRTFYKEYLTLKDLVHTQNVS